MPESAQSAMYIGAPMLKRPRGPQGTLVVLEHRSRIGALAATVAVGRGDALVFVLERRDEDVVFVRHLLPNALTPLVVDVTLRIGDLILLEAALSFLGLGIQPPVPSWGNMIAEIGRAHV